MRYPKILFVYCNENDDYSWDCNRQETWTGEVRYILQSEYDKLKAENERLREGLREIANSAGIDACGYTTGEGHSDCIWKARKALKEVKECHT